jgi:hypothetical protein
MQIVIVIIVLLHQKCFVLLLQLLMLLVEHQLLEDVNKLLLVILILQKNNVKLMRMEIHVDGMEQFAQINLVLPPNQQSIVIHYVELIYLLALLQIQDQDVLKYLLIVLL